MRDTELLFHFQLMQQAAQRQAAAMHHMQQQQDHFSGKGPFRRETQTGGGGGGDPLLMRQLTLEAQREFMVRRGGFSQNHPFVSGEVSVHPELQGGRLPFHVPPARYVVSCLFSIITTLYFMNP